MTTALIGHTGFVGSNIAQQMKFDAYYNSKNISEINGQKFDLLIVSAAPAVKWWANKNPEQDLAHLQGLMSKLATVEAKRVVLISTIDVYPSPVEVDEDTPIDLKTCHPYGKHRLMLEHFLSERFLTQTLRLPGLFGDGLKKNVIFDFLNNNEIEKVDTRHNFQFYYLNHIASDIERFISSGIRLLNLAVEPVDTASVAEICLGRPYKNEVAPNVIHYDFRSKYADAMKGANGYLYSKKIVLDDLRHFVAKFRNNGASK